MISFSLQKVLHTAEGKMPLAVNARIESGQFVSLYGVSGAGKTSILRMLAGLMKPDNGSIRVNDTVWFDAAAKTDLAPQQRSTGFVFQDYALFPNMNVRENISFALRRHDSRQIVDELLEVTGLSNLAERKVQALSGGQQQRVALARAIAKKPSILLLDEPLSAIDTAMRGQLQDTLLAIHKRYGLTTILVSHNADEIIKLSDVVIHLEQGRFRQQAAPLTFFRNDGNGGLLTGSIVAMDANGHPVVLLDNRLLTLPAAGHSFRLNDKVTIHCSHLERQPARS